MKRITHCLTLTCAAFALMAGTSSLVAQPAQGQGQGRGNRGNFDPAQMTEMRQRASERMREQFGVKDDGEWKLVEERITKVTEARRGTTTGFGGMMGMRRPGGQGAQGGPGGGGPGGGFGQASPEVAALQTVLENTSASNEEIKAKLTAAREARKANQVKLAKAQEELAQVLNVRQTAVAFTMGLLE